MFQVLQLNDTLTQVSRFTTGG